MLNKHPKYLQRKISVKRETTDVTINKIITESIGACL